MNKTIFLVTADAYELPVYIARTWGELSKLSGISKSTLYLSYVRGKVIRKKYRVEVYNFF